MNLDPDIVACELATRKQSAPIKFTKRQQETIKKKYENRCALCCLGVEDGVAVCVVHKMSRVDGGKATIKNGQVLCLEHNETRYDTDTNDAKTYVSLMLKVARHRKDERKKKFYFQLLKIFKEYKIV